MQSLLNLPDPDDFTFPKLMEFCGAGGKFIILATELNGLSLYGTVVWANAVAEFGVGDYRQNWMAINFKDLRRGSVVELSNGN